MSIGHWYTLVPFRGGPQQLTGVSQARTPLEALDQLALWAQRHPDDTTIVFDRDNRPVEREHLEDLATGLRPPRQHPGA